jgi:hypothetical protein
VSTHLRASGAVYRLTDIPGREPPITRTEGCGARARPAPVRASLTFTVSSTWCTMAGLAELPHDLPTNLTRNPAEAA